MNSYTKEQMISTFNIDNSTFENLSDLCYFEICVNNSCSDILIVRKEKGGLVIGKTFLNDDHYYWSPWQSAKFTDGYTFSN
jgi:hypothetical protein